MGFFSDLFGGKKKNVKRFRGQGNSEENAMHHAEQRFTAWVKELEKDNLRPVLKNKKSRYVKKNAIMIICYIDCEFDIQKA